MRLGNMRRARLCIAALTAEIIRAAASVSIDEIIELNENLHEK